MVVHAYSKAVSLYNNFFAEAVTESKNPKSETLKINLKSNILNLLFKKQTVSHWIVIYVILC
jgi:hypothetical protein